jgi:hemerythrin-like domain-containing protein
MEINKPIKRNTAIAEFSKDHHFGLLLVWKIREGLKKSIELNRISRYILYFFQDSLIPHFKEEEEILFCLIPSDNALRMRAESEHSMFYKMVEELRNNPEDKQLIQNFADLLEKHIRFEERELFNFLQENISESGLQAVAAKLKAREQKEGSAWTDTFWERT